MNKTRFIILGALAVTVVVLGFVASSSAAIHYVNDGESIQAAIDAANATDTIIVYDGHYPENVLVNKSLTIKNGSLPLIDGMGGTAFNITAENVTIDGFNITNCSYGINCSALGFTIVNNTINASVDGINLYLHDIGCNLTGDASYTIGNSTIFNNVINATNDGIHLDALNWGRNVSGNSAVDIGAVMILNNR